MYICVKSHSFLRILVRNTFIRYSSFDKFRKGEELVKLVHKNTVISRNHLTPEILLHLITPECELWYNKVEESVFEDPFWAFYWPGGQAISRYILDNPKIVENLTVLDVGCGSGGCSIASAMSKAKTVTANDIDHVACMVTSMNAELNNVQLQINSENLLGADVPFDCIIVGDMFYESEFASQLMEWLLDLHKKGKTVLIGDPGRWAFENYRLKRQLKLVIEYMLPENVIFENKGFSSASVWTFS